MTCESTNAHEQAIVHEGATWVERANYEESTTRLERRAVRVRRLPSAGLPECRHQHGPTGDASGSSMPRD